jgi:hypothetical protein
MRKALVCLLFILLPAAKLPAQDVRTVPVGEIGFGWSYLRLGENWAEAAGLPGGWLLSAGGNVNPWLGFVAEFSGHYGDREFPLLAGTQAVNIAVDSNVHTFLFGPRVFYRENRSWTPYGHALFGAARLHTDTEDFGPFARPIDETETPLALLLGGGLDLAATEKISIKALQIDYLLTRPSDTNVNSVRISVGLNYRWF